MSPFVLVEFAGREQATRRDERFVQLVHHRGLADPGITGHKHDLRRAVRHDPVEGSEQHINLALPAVKLLRDEQPVWRTSCVAQREQVDVAMRLPFCAGSVASRSASTPRDRRRF